MSRVGGRPPVGGGPRMPQQVEGDFQGQVEEVDEMGSATEDGDRESRGRKDALALMEEYHEAAAESEERGREALELLGLDPRPKKKRRRR